MNQVTIINIIYTYLENLGFTVSTFTEIDNVTIFSIPIKSRFIAIEINNTNLKIYPPVDKTGHTEITTIDLADPTAFTHLDTILSPHIQT